MAVRYILYLDLSGYTFVRGTDITLWFVLVTRTCFSEKCWILGLFKSLATDVFPMTVTRFEHKTPWFLDRSLIFLVIHVWAVLP